MCRDSSIGIATHYGLYGPGIESRWKARFSAPVQPGPGAHPASYKMGTGSFPGVKRPGPPPFSAEGLWAFAGCCRVKFTFTFSCYLAFNYSIPRIFILSNTSVITPPKYIIFIH